MLLSIVNFLVKYSQKVVIVLISQIISCNYKPIIVSAKKRREKRFYFKKQLIISLNINDVYMTLFRR